MVKRNIRGSFTVEAAVVVSLVWIFTAMFLQLALYVHDAGIMTAAAYEAAQKGAALKNCGRKSAENFAAAEAESLLQDRRLACTVKRVYAAGNDRRMVVGIEAETGFFGGLKLHVEKKAARYNPVDYLRLEKRVCGLWKEKGGEGT